MGRYDEWIEELVGRLILEEPEGNLFLESPRIRWAVLERTQGRSCGLDRCDLSSYGVSAEALLW